MSKDHLPLLLVAIAWGALWANLVVLPFFSKDETLFKDLIDSGARDLALSGIEEEKITPALTRLIDEVLRERQRQGDGASVANILVELDLQVYLADAEAAMKEKQTIHGAFDYLGILAGLLWKVGVAHIVFALAIAASIIFLQGSTWQDALAYGCAGMALATMLLGFAMLVLFERRKKLLYGSLSKFRRAKA